MKTRLPTPPDSPPPDDDPDDPDGADVLAHGLDDDWSQIPVEECWDALIPDDDYEPQPEPGDFWTAEDAA